MSGFGWIVYVVIAVLLISLVVKIFKAPIKLAFKLLLNMVSGFITLLIFNFIAGIFGFTLTITWVSALVAGVLGIPGVILLVLFAAL